MDQSIDNELVNLVPEVPEYFYLASKSGWPLNIICKEANIYVDHLTSLRILRSLSFTKSGERWVHISVSRPDKLPSWDELTMVKNVFLGENAEAYQVLASKKDHVNIHPYCLHLWMPVDKKRRVANLQDLMMEKAL